ncbi:hypothetical protein C8R46DRAFT_1269664 [Mycena filopes]|nr:hypothetical protein C8R46DRAFT_1269664 [Mycena filopes]
MSIANLRKQLADIDASIARHTLVLKGLKRHRSLVTAELDSRASFPVLSLPVEITTAIFSFCLPTVEELYENNRRHRDATLASPKPSAPNVLVECCRAWRDIAFATPFLWTTLPLCLTDDDFGSEPTAKGRGRADEYADRWLGRTGLQPLTFVFSLEQENNADLRNSGPPPDFDTPSPIRSMRDIINRYADRLQELQLEFAAAFFGFMIMDLHSIHFPLLERAVLGNNDPSHDLVDAFNVFDNAPRLREFNVRPGTLLLCDAPWMQLTKFKGPIYDLDLFSMAANLLIAECTVDKSYGNSEIVHPRLQSLAISGSYTSGVMDLLDALTLPALLSLDVTPSVPLPTFWSFLGRSAPSLCALSANVDHNAFEPWEPILNSVAATLESLRVSCPTAEFLSGILRLGLSPQSRCRLPHLQHLSILESPVVDHEQLVNFLYRRSTSNDLVRLQSFRLLYRPGTLSDEAEEFIAGEYDTGKRRWWFNTTNRISPEDGIDIHIRRGETSLVSFEEKQAGEGAHHG